MMYVHRPGRETKTFVTNLFARVQTRRPGEHVVNAICETAECAGRIALLTLAGKLPRTYQFEWDCLAAWRAQPASCDARYLPWRVTVHENPSTGFKIVATSRIDRT